MSMIVIVVCSAFLVSVFGYWLFMPDPHADSPESHS